MQKRAFKFLIAIFFLGFLSEPTQALVVWDWQVINDGSEYGPLDVVEQKIVIHNQSTEGETIGLFFQPEVDSYIHEIILGFWGSSNDIRHGNYKMEMVFPFADLEKFGPPMIPGESRKFIFVQYTPTGPLSPGEYFASRSFNSITLYDPINGKQPINREFNWSVVNPVPEPTGLGMMSLSGVMMMTYKGFRKNLRNTTG